MIRPLEMADNLADMRALNSPLEGRVPCMYLDVKGLVTTGVGNLIDDARDPARGLALAQRLHWLRPDGSLASPVEVSAAWHTVKVHGQPKRLWRTWALELTNLRLPDSEIDHLCDLRLLENEQWIVAHHVPWDEWREIPADAQLCAMSIAWACGADFPRKWPKFWAAFRARDWAQAYANCTIREAGNPGIIPRNEANRLMLANAQVVEELNLDRDKLHWPARLGRPVKTEPAQAPAELIPLTIPEWEDDLRTAHNLDMYQ